MNNYSSGSPPTCEIGEMITRSMFGSVGGVKNANADAVCIRHLSYGKKQWQAVEGGTWQGVILRYSWSAIILSQINTGRDDDRSLALGLCKLGKPPLATCSRCICPGTPASESLPKLPWWQ